MLDGSFNQPCLQTSLAPSTCRSICQRLPLELMPLKSPSKGKRRAEQNDMDKSTKKRRKDAIAHIGAPVAPPKLRIFTDFSGIEAPILALEGLGVDYLHVGSCEKSLSLHKFICRNFRRESCTRIRVCKHIRIVCTFISSLICHDVLAKLSCPTPQIGVDLGMLWIDWNET